MEVFVSLISTVGFPIACVIALGAFVWTIYKRSEKREDELREEIRNNQELNAKMIETLALYAKDISDIQTDINEIKTIIMN